MVVPCTASGDTSQLGIQWEEPHFSQTGTYTVCQDHHEECCADRWVRGTGQLVDSVVWGFRQGGWWGGSQMSDIEQSHAGIDSERAD